MKIKFLIFLLFVSIVFHNKNAIAMKIVATVGSEIVTDYDVEMFTKLMCNVSNKKSKTNNCKPKEIMNDVVLMIVENKLKGFYIEKMNIDVSQDKDLQKYIDNTMAEYDIDESVFDKNDYLEIRKYVSNDYIWNIILMSFANSQKLTDNEVESYIKKNPSIKNKDEAKHAISIERAAQKANEIMINLRKFYLVEFRI